MPHVQLTFGEAEHHLPDVCLRCGQPATCRVSKAIRLHDTASGYSRGPIGFMTMLFDFQRHLTSPTVTLRGPFCAAHSNHWAFRRTLIWTLVGLMPVALIGIVLLWSAEVLKSGTARFLAFAVLFAGILAAAIAFGTSCIKISSNSRAKTFVLAHAHPRFIEALERQREESPSVLDDASASSSGARNRRQSRGVG